MKKIVRRKAGVYAKKRAMRRGYRTNSNLRSLNPIAQRYICKMKYAETYVAALGGGTYAPFVLNLNSIFDPNRTGGGHQPYAHDTLSTLYNRYRVISCRYRVAVNSSDNATDLQLAVIPTNEAIAPITISEVRENPRAKYVLQAPRNDIRTVSGNVYIPSLVGRTKTQYMADDRYQATFGTTPNELALLNCYAGPTTEAGSTISVTFNVMLEYVVECFDVKHLTQS